MSFVARFVRFNIELSDTFAHRYETLSFKLPLHEDEDELLFYSRVIAYLDKYNSNLILRPHGQEYHEASLIEFKENDILREERGAVFFGWIGIPSLKAISKISRDCSSALFCIYAFSDNDVEKFIESLGSLKHALMPRLSFSLLESNQIYQFQSVVESHHPITALVMAEDELTIASDRSSVDVSIKRL